MKGRLALAVGVSVGLVAAGAGGFELGRITDDDQSSGSMSADANPEAALVMACDEADGIWLNRLEVNQSDLIANLPIVARVPGCYRQIGPATAWILDLSYSGEDAMRWATENQFTQQDVIDLTIRSNP